MSTGKSGQPCIYRLLWQSVDGRWRIVACVTHNGTLYSVLSLTDRGQWLLDHVIPQKGVLYALAHWLDVGLHTQREQDAKEAGVPLRDDATLDGESEGPVLDRNSLPFGIELPALPPGTNGYMLWVANTYMGFVPDDRWARLRASALRDELGGPDDGASSGDNGDSSSGENKQ